MLALVLPTSFALAAPTFTGPPDSVRLAQAAWAAAEACTGRSPPVTEVRIVHDLPEVAPGGGIAGLATYPAGKPAQIRLAKLADALVVAHEVAHAWVHDGPRALVEGRTEVLAQCVQAREPSLFAGLQDRPSQLEHLPDLRAWNRAATDVTAVEESLDAYLGSFRYFRAVAEVVPPERLWAADLTTWEALDALLAAAGDRGKPLRDALAGGVATQRAALGDLDLDGLPGLQEGLLGTDPARYDTDGDGWWDGAPADRPDGAVPLPRGKHSVCLPRVPAAGTPIVLRYGGALGGIALPERADAQLLPGSVVTWVSGWSTFPGGVWVTADGDALAPNASCGMRPGVTIRATGTAPAGDLDALAAGIHEALGVYERRGVPRADVVVTVSARTATLDWISGELYLPEPFAAADAGAVGRQVAAFALTRDLSIAHRSAAAAALVRATYGNAHDVATFGVPVYAIAEWTRAAKRCDAGWGALLDGRCDSPAGAARVMAR